MAGNPGPQIPKFGLPPTTAYVSPTGPLREVGTDRSPAVKAGDKCMERVNCGPQRAAGTVGAPRAHARRQGQPGLRSSRPLRCRQVGATWLGLSNLKSQKFECLHHTSPFFKHRVN